jgi:hypothetical protein
MISAIRFSHSTVTLIKVTVLCFIYSLSANSKLYSQYNLKENSNWVFGSYTGISFNNNTVSPITSGLSGRGAWIEGTASVSDSNGNLLFYSSADSIWDKTGHVMPNGYELMHFYYAPGHDTNYSGNSSTQGSLIIPVIDSPQQYYVFSLGQMEDYFNGDLISCRLFYSIVDMRLRGGLGDVIQNKKSIELDSFLSEKMIAIPGSNCDIWLMVHGRGNRIFKAYNITSHGISLNPIISNLGTIFGQVAYACGEMKVSNNWKKISTCNSQDSNYSSSSAKGIEIYDFDQSTGIVTNVFLLNNTIKTPYGLCFSPDDSKLYVNAGLAGIYQIDLNSNRFDSITWVDNQWASEFRSLKLGLDNKIYFNSLTSADSISRIDSPNNFGFSCHISDDIMKLNQVFYGLPNQFVKPQCPTEIKSIPANSNIISISPNPFSTKFTINNCTPNSLFIVYNIVGEKVISGTIFEPSIRIETSEWNDGIYIVEIISPDGSKRCFKVVK